MTHGAGEARPVAYTGLGVYSYRITTSSPDSQRWFNQGLRLVYAFNHNEAQKAFREAARLDPSCAMCYWGIAITEGSQLQPPDRRRARERGRSPPCGRRRPTRSSPSRRSAR